MKRKINLKYSLFYFAFIILFNSCISIKPVEVLNADNFRLTDVLAAPTVQFEVKIHNPNNFGLTIKEFKSTAFAGDKIITDIFIDKKILIPANSDISIPIETKPSIKDISNMFISGSASKDFKIEGYVIVKKFVIRKKFPFTVKTKL